MFAKKKQRNKIDSREKQMCFHFYFVHAFLVENNYNYNNLMQINRRNDR